MNVIVVIIRIRGPGVWVNFRNFYITWLIVSLRAAVGSFDWESGDDHVIHETYKC
jgi:hypothetical protein